MDSNLLFLSYKTRYWFLLRKLQFNNHGIQNLYLFMVIKGGKYHGYNPGHATSEAGANLVPDGYQVTSETSGSDTYYSVSKVQ